ncbi:MAG: transporter [Actinoallomurus sp.]|nr:transporter [Actinoallomurus sp.]
MKLSPALRHRDFNLYWFGVVFSQIGTRGTVAANLYQVYELSRSTTITGLVGLAQAVSLLILSPLGGAYADRLDRRRLLQATQLVALVVAGALAVLTEAGKATTPEVLVCVLLTTAAGTFDQPARQALIPAMVPRKELPQAFALLNPSRELAVLLGPASFRHVSGRTELQITSTEPGWRKASRPPSGRHVAATSSSLCRQTRQTSAPVPSSASESQIRAPRSASGRVASGLMSRRRTSKPARRMCAAIGPPIAPRPSAATTVMA